MRHGLEWLAQLWKRREREVAEHYGRLGPLALADLAAFCHANRTTFASSQDETLINEGRRQVYLHVAEMLDLKPGDFLHLEEMRIEQDQRYG